MYRRDKIGLVAIIVLLLVLMATLVWSLWDSYRPSHDFSESIFVKQRIINLKK